MRIWSLLMCAAIGCGRIGYGETAVDGGGQADAAVSPDAPAAPDAPPAPDAAPPDAALADAAPDAALGPWGPPARVNELSTTGDEDDPTLTDDMLEIVFASTRAGGLGGEDIWTSRRATIADPWDPPQPVPELSSPSVETTPEITGDGLMIWLSSNRPGSIGANDIWASTRATRSDPWSAPVHVAELSTANDDASPTPWAGGLRMVLHSDLPGGPGSYDVFASQRLSTISLWDTPVRDLDVSSAGQDIQPFQVNTLTLFFSSNRAGDFDLYETTRASAVDPFGSAVPLTDVNDPIALDNDPWVSGDLRTIYFTSNRGFGGDLDLYVSTR